MKNTRLSLCVTLIALSFAVCFFACSKYKDSTYAPYAPIPVESQVVASLQGRVLDENGSPVSDASVASGGSTTTTDLNGVFSFQKIQLSSRFGFVKVTKSGYFTGSRSIITNAGALNYVNIQLSPRVLKNSFAASTGGSVIVQTGDTANFSGSSVVTAATNIAYTGNVHVYASYLDPTNGHFSATMPGDLRGTGTDGKETPLLSYGMMAVELQGDGGEKLQLAAGQKSTITLAIPAAMQAKAPETAPLWYFNDSSGRWIQEGTATRQGNNYVGQVSHFTYWTTAFPYPAVLFKVKVKDQSGNPVSYKQILFKSQSPDWGGTVSAYTDSAGFSQGLIPDGISLTMEVLSECGTVLAGANVGPAFTDQDLGTITATLTYADITVSGKVVDCSNNPVDSGAVSVRVDGLSYGAIVRNGNFTLPIMRCYNTATQISVQAIDLVSLKQSSVATVSGQSGAVDAGTLTICSDSNNNNNNNPEGRYFTFTFKGVSATYTSEADTLQGIYAAAYGQFEIIGNRLNYVSPDPSGVGNTVNLYLNNFHGVGYYNQIYNFLYTDPVKGYDFFAVGGHCSITQYDSVGGYIIGTMGGDLLDQSRGASGNSFQPITGAFKVLRTM